MKQYQISDDIANNQQVLIQFLRDHAEQFNMDNWYHGCSWEPPPDVTKFEECGYPCCIGGAMCILTQEDLNKVEEIGKIKFGVNDDVFYTHEWPDKLAQEYREAMLFDEFNVATNAAIKAIKHFSLIPQEEE